MSATSVLSCAVTKMIGVISDCFRVRMSAAVSTPFMMGICTSRRITAKLWVATQRNASTPDSASTMEYPSEANTELSAMRFAALSSTRRMGTSGPAPAPPLSAVRASATGMAEVMPPWAALSSEATA